MPVHFKEIMKTYNEKVSEYLNRGCLLWVNDERQKKHLSSVILLDDKGKREIVISIGACEAPFPTKTSVVAKTLTVTEITNRGQLTELERTTWLNPIDTRDFYLVEDFPEELKFFYPIS